MIMRIFGKLNFLTERTEVDVPMCDDGPGG